MLTSVTHRAMACEFAVMLPPGETHHVEPVVDSLEMLDHIEQSLTIYDSQSEISRLNREAATAPVKLSQPTFGLLQRAMRWSQLTEGAFDVTAGPLVEAWGFTQRSGRKPSNEEIEAARAKVGYQHLILDSKQQTGEFAVPGMMVNLGAIGKGEALDRVADALTAQGVQNFLVSGGNSSMLARGDQDPGSGQGWAIGISHPTKPQRRLKGIWLQDKALATSGSGKQYFHHQGKRLGHVIDPRTGYPSGALLALTAVTQSAADADACATGMFVAGAEKMAELSEQESIAMVSISAGRRQDEVQLEAFGEIQWVEDESP